MNRVALENVKTELLIKRNHFKDEELEAIRDNRIPSQIEMYHDMSELYGGLLNQLNEVN